MTESRLHKSYSAIQVCIFFICSGQVFGSFNFLFLNSLGLNLIDLGIVGAVSTFTTTILRLPSGWMLDKTGKNKPFVTSALILMSLVYFLYYFTHSFNTFLLMSFLMSVANVFVMGPAYEALLMGIIGTFEAGKKIGRYRIWGSLSWIILQPVAGLLAGSFSLRILFPLGALFYVCAAVSTLFIYEPSRKEKSEPLMDRDFKEFIVQRDLVVLLITQAISGLVGYVYGFRDIYLKQIGASLGFIGLVKGLWVIPEIPSLLLFPKMSDRVGRWPIISLALFVTPVQLFVFGTTSNIYILFVTQLMYNFLTFGSHIVITVYTSELVPVKYRASVFAITSTVARLPGILGQYFSGYLGELYGLPFMYLIKTVIAIVPPTFFTAANSKKIKMFKLKDGKEKTK